MVTAFGRLTSYTDGWVQFRQLSWFNTAVRFSSAGTIAGQLRNQVVHTVVVVIVIHVLSQSGDQVLVSFRFDIFTL